MGLMTKLVTKKHRFRVPALDPAKREPVPICACHVQKRTHGVVLITNLITKLITSVMITVITSLVIY